MQGWVAVRCVSVAAQTATPGPSSPRGSGDPDSPGEASKKRKADKEAHQSPQPITAVPGGTKRRQSPELEVGTAVIVAGTLLFKNDEAALVTQAPGVRGFHLGNHGAAACHMVNTELSQVTSKMGVGEASGTS